MFTIGWPTAIVFIMGYYWPVSLFLAISLIACSFTFTKKNNMEDFRGNTGCGHYDPGVFLMVDFSDSIIMYQGF